MAPVARCVGRPAALRTGQAGVGARRALTRRRAVLRPAQDGNPPVRVIIYCHGNACDIGEVYVNLKQCVAPARRVLARPSSSPNAPCLV